MSASQRRKATAGAPLQPRCCQTAQEVDALRWAGGGFKVALYVDGGIVESTASYCPFCGAPLPPKDHPMRSFCSDEVLALYDEAMSRAQRAEQANYWLRGVALELREAHTARKFARVARLAERIVGTEGSPEWHDGRVSRAELVQAVIEAAKQWASRVDGNDGPLEEAVRALEALDAETATEDA